MGKKGKDKFSRMTDEEKARYMQHRADIEEEAKRRKQQLIAIFMKNKLKREEAFSRLNLAKINQEWRTILRQLKCKELKMEIEATEKDFSSAIARKDVVIRRLLNDLDESEEMYATMLHSHMENIEKLIDIYNSRLDFWRDYYTKEKQSIFQQYNEEFDRYKELKLKAYVELECVHYGLDDLAKESECKAAEDHLKNLDNVKSDLVIKLQKVTETGEEKVEKLWNEFQQILNDYLQQTEEMHTEYVALRQRDDEDTKLIRSHYIQVAKTTEDITELRTMLEGKEDEQRVQLTELKQYKRLLQEKLERIKQTIEEQLKSDKDYLRYMVVCSNETITTLQAILKQGDNIMQLLSMCRKYETEREIEEYEALVKQRDNNDEALKETKPISSIQFLDEQGKPNLKIQAENLNLAPLENLAELDNFWIRYNTVRIDCLSLDREKNELKKRNTELRDQLKDYLTQVALNEGNGMVAVDHIRPKSMIVDRSVQIDFATKSANLRQRPVTCIEGNLSVAVRSKRLIQSSKRLNQSKESYSIVH